MLATFLRRIGGISLALIGSIIIIGALVLITGSITFFSQEPADILPGQATQLLIYQADDAILENLSPWLPVLDQVPAASTARTVAIMDFGTGSMAVAEFFTDAAPDTGQTFGQYTIRTTPPEAQSLLQKRIDSLTSYEAYRTTAMGRENTASPWLYTNTKLLQTSEDPLSALLHQLILADATYFSTPLQGSGTLSIHLYQPEYIPLTAAAPAIPLATGGLLSLSVQEANQHWQQAIESLPSSQRIVLSSLTQSWLNRAFGPTVSLPHEILPLLHQDTAVQISRNQSGTLLATVYTTPDTATIIETVLDRMHRGRRGQLPQTSILNTMLDNRFGIINLSNNAGSITQTEGTYNRWQTQKTLANDSQHGLFTATNGRALIVTTTESALYTALDTYADHNGSPPSGTLILQSTVIGSGQLDSTALQHLLQTTIPEFTTLQTFLPMPTANQLSWSLRQRGNLRTFTVTPTENPTSPLES